MFNRLRRTLVARAPDLFRIPARLMPFAVQQLVMERLLEDVSFSAGTCGSQEIRIDAAYVDERLRELARNEDLSRYIL